MHLFFEADISRIKNRKLTFFVHRCRHATISNYFGDDTVPECNKSCDVCKNPVHVQKMIKLYEKGQPGSTTRPIQFNSFAVDFDSNTSDLYEGGRKKRKRLEIITHAFAIGLDLRSLFLH
jgi:hypothetical protein